MIIERCDTVPNVVTKTIIAAFAVMVVTLLDIQQSWIKWIVFGLVVILCVRYIYRTIRVRSVLGRRGEQMVQFAGRHNYSMSFRYPTKTKMFRLVLGENQKFENPIQGDDWRYSDLSYAIVNHSKNGDYEVQQVYYSVLELDLERPLPNMLFDSPQSHSLGHMSEIDESQRTSLEGDFDQYFMTYFPKHYHIDSRSIITPEVMEAMIQSGVCDIEIVGRKLYLYSPLLDVKYLKDFIDDGTTIRAKLMDHAVSYRDDRVVSAMSHNKEVSVFGKNLRQKSKMPWRTIIFTIGASLYMAPAISRTLERGDPFDMVMLLGIYIGVVLVAWYEVKHSWFDVRQTNHRMERRYAERHSKPKS